MRRLNRRAWQWILAALFIVAGANHFLNPEPYLLMMPRAFPAPRLLVEVSGIAEMLGGLGLLLRPVRAAAAWGLIVLLLAVFPANLNVALHGWPGTNLPAWSLWLRLPFQFVFIWWIYRVCIAGEGTSRPASAKETSPRPLN